MLDDPVEDVAVDVPEVLDVLDGEVLDDESDEEADAAVSFFAPASDEPEPFAPVPFAAFVDARESVL